MIKTLLPWTWNEILKGKKKQKQTSNLVSFISFIFMWPSLSVLERKLNYLLIQTAFIRIRKGLLKLNYIHIPEMERPFWEYYFFLIYFLFLKITLGFLHFLFFFFSSNFFCPGGCHTAFPSLFIFLPSVWPFCLMFLFFTHFSCCILTAHCGMISGHPDEWKKMCLGAFAVTWSPIWWQKDKLSSWSTEEENKLSHRFTNWKNVKV